MGSPPLPRFFVIGASKAGTTSLHHYLDAHPEIEMTDPKEPHLLCGPPDYRSRLFVYESLFSGREAIRGEASPGYAAYPHDPEVPERIATLVAGARLLYLVRDPVERAIAHYAEHVIQGVESRLPDEALVPDPACPYVAASRYATQLERYLLHFDQERLVVVESSELRDDRREALRRIFAHVGADPGYWNDEAFAVEHYSRAADNTRRTAAERAIGGSAVYRRVLRPLLGAGARRAVTRQVRRRFGRLVIPEVDDDDRARLSASLAPETERLRALTGRRFAGWSV